MSAGGDAASSASAPDHETQQANEWPAIVQRGMRNLSGIGVSKPK